MKLVVLGAGASYDSAGESATVDEAWRPPLAKELFDIRARPQFEDVLELYHGASVLATELAPLSAQPGFSLEEQLRSYANHDSPRIQEHFADIPRYLRHLIWRCCYFTRIPDSYVQLCMRLLEDSSEPVSFLVLNYDTLLEKALLAVDPEYTFENRLSYISPRRARVYKVHGSINWQAPMVQTLPTPNGPPLTPPRKAEVHWVVKPPDHSLIRRKPRPPTNQVDRYPAITSPLAGKTQEHFVCGEEHLAALRHDIAQCTKFLFIGTSGLDNNVFELIEANIKQRPQAIHFVSPTATEDFQRILGGYPRLRMSLARAIPMGFREYLANKAFHAFLNS